MVEKTYRFLGVPIGPDGPGKAWINNRCLQPGDEITLDSNDPIFSTPRGRRFKMVKKKKKTSKKKTTKKSEAKEETKKTGEKEVITDGESMESSGNHD